MKGGIYTITNKINGKIYVGHTNNFNRRKRQHDHSLYHGRSKNYHLQKAYNKYGKENFEFEILEECENKYLAALEHYWCNILNTHSINYGYNIKPTCPNGYSKLSEEVKAKIAAAMKGRKASEQKLKRMPESRKKLNLKLSEKHKQALVAASTGRKMSDNVKKALIDANKKIILQYDLNGNFIKEWESISSTPFPISNVARCCQNNEREIKAVSFKHIWIYKEETILPKIDISKIFKRNKEILQFTKDSIFIKEWKSTTEIEKCLGFHDSNITNSCKKENIFSYNFKWRYKYAI